jgi:hypothetical protein
MPTQLHNAAASRRPGAQQLRQVVQLIILSRQQRILITILPNTVAF